MYFSITATKTTENDSRRVKILTVTANNADTALAYARCELRRRRLSGDYADLAARPVARVW